MEVQVLLVSNFFCCISAKEGYPNFLDGPGIYLAVQSLCAR